MHYLQKNQIWGFKEKKRAHPTNDLIFPLLSLEAYFQTGHTRHKAPLTWEATFELHFTVALFGTFQAPFGILRATWILGLICPRDLKCKDTELMGAAGLQSPPRSWFRLQEQQSTCPVRDKDGRTALLRTWDHAASCPLVPPQHMPHPKAEPGKFQSF